MREHDEAEKELEVTPEIPETPEAPLENENTEIETEASEENADTAAEEETDPAADDDASIEAEESEESEDSEDPQEDSEEEDGPRKERKPIDWKVVGKTLMTAASVFIMLLGICLTLYYIWGPARGEFHSDSTDTLYWAEAAMQGKGLINPDFNYAALMPFGGNLFMQLWIPFFGVSMTTHSLGMTTFFVAFAGSVFWMLTEMKWSFRWKGVTIGGILMALSLSEKLREIFWGHIIYYSLGMLFLVIGLAFVMHIYNIQEKQKNGTNIRLIIALVIFLALFVILCTNSTTAIALFALPILAALFCERFLDHSQPLLNKKTLLGGIMLVLCGIGVVAGMKLGEMIAGNVVAGYASAYSRFSDKATWWEHIEGLPLALLNLLGLNIDPGTELMSLAGINTIMLIAYALILVIIPIIALCFYGKIKDTGTRMLIISHFVVTAFIMVGYICGLLNAANWRLSPILVSAFLVSIAFMRWIYLNTEMRRFGVLLLLPVGYICGIGAYGIMQMPADSYLDNTNYKLAQFLVENDLEYGYATFWNCQAITVQSDSETKVRNVDIDSSGVRMNDYQSNRTWYEDQEGQDDYFLLMTQGERDLLVSSGHEILARPRHELECQGYIIWIYEENVF